VKEELTCPPFPLTNVDFMDIKSQNVISKYHKYNLNLSLNYFSNVGLENLKTGEILLIIKALMSSSC
jgi:hypothetical protein